MKPNHVTLKCLFASVLLVWATKGYSQSGIQGSITDASDKPLVNANVLLLKAKDSSLVKGTVTTKNGEFSFSNIASGSYLVSATFVGFSQVYSTIIDLTNSNETKKIAILRFTESDVTLSDVRVTAKKSLIEQKMDRMVINVAGSITAAGNSALEVLERSPGILVDRQNNSISMNGKSGLVIMINGRISRLPIASLVQMLAGMNAANIEKIELITTPPANFEAEGNAGYINIVLKTNTQYGTNGSYSLTAGYGEGLISAASLNFNHRKNKINFYGDLAASQTNYNY